MASWQPPIPSGALYSKPARHLGPALALLAYCYDLVGRDGWCDLVLKDAAGDMQEPYPNVKRWWQALKDGPFFCEVIDRGRLGWRVRFKDVWLDWRIVQSRPEEPPSRTNEGSEMSLENLQGQFKDSSRTTEGSEMIPEGPAYKVLHGDHESDLPVASQPVRRRAKAPNDPTAHQELMAAYAEWLGYPIPNGAQEGSAAKRLLAAGYTLAQIERAYHDLKARPFYGSQHLSLQTVHTNIGALLTAPQEHTNGRLGSHPQARNGMVSTGTQASASDPPAGGAERGKLRRARIDW